MKKQKYNNKRQKSKRYIAPFALAIVLSIVFASMVGVSAEKIESSEITSVEITSLPFTADVEGETYYLTGDLVCPDSDAAGITIAADGVTIDGQGYSISGTTTPADCEFEFPVRACGVLIYGYDNVKIYNLEIETFGTGIVLQGIADNKVQGCEIINCKIHDNGFDTPSGGSEMQTQGIHTQFIQQLSGKPGVLIKGCDIYNTKGTGAACDGGGSGIFSLGGGANPNDKLVLIGNRLYDNDRAGFATKQGLDHSQFSYNEIYGNGNGPDVGDFVGGIVMRCKSTNNNIVSYNSIHDNNDESHNKGTGIFVGGNNNEIYCNYVIDNDIGIFCGRTDASDNNGINDNTVKNHPFIDVKSVTGKTNTGDNNCADTAENYQDDNPASGKDFTYDTSNLVSCYYDFDEDGYYSEEISYGQNLLDVGVCCLPGMYDGSSEAMAHHESFGPCIFTVGNDPHDCDETITGEGPTTPTVAGPTSGNKGTEYDYIFQCITPDSCDVYYYIDWDDGEIEDWIGPYASGEEVTVPHTWDEKGAYIIKAKAKDIHDAESDWGSLSVTMPKAKAVNSPILYRFLENHPLIQLLFNYLF
jgi:hypothetical protein